MRWIHRATITAFAKPEENTEEIKESIIALVPFDLKEAKITLEEQKAEGFDERKIIIYTINLLKESHTNDFLQFLLDQLTQQQKKTLIEQTESRLDNECNYFIRIEKDKWTNEREIELTDTGHCYHIKLTLAAYPKNRDNAKQLIQKILIQKNI